MLSARGALTTNVAMVECAAGQNTSNRDLFLLSELETVWVAVGLVMRRHLLEGRAVQLPNFGTFSLAESHLFTDKVHRTRYFVRQLHFSVNPKFATTYNIDTTHYAMEKPNAPCTRLPWVEVVEACGVPAQTAVKALKEFFLYVGEGLFRRRMFQLTFPGVVTLVLKRERLMLTVDWEFQLAIFDVDAYRWPPEMKQRGRACLEERVCGRAGAGGAERADGTAEESRPTSSSSRVSWRPPTQPSAADGGAAAVPRKTFVAAAPAGRLFSEIEKETRRHRQMKAIEKADAEQAQRREHDVERRLQRYYDCYQFDEMRADTTRRPTESRPVTASELSRPGTGESIYRWVEATQTIELVSPQGQHEEPEIEAIEVVAVSAPQSDAGDGDTRRGVAEADVVEPHFEPRSVVGKNAELEKVLRDEEPFSRPMSRKSCGPQSAVRDLIYGASTEVKVRDGAPSSATGVVTAPPPTHAVVLEPPMRFGRKRYDYGMEPQPDSVGSLLKRDD